MISAARRFVVIAEASKRVDRLGERFGLPVEVVRFGWKDIAAAAIAAPTRFELRVVGDQPFVTDEGHYILDAPIRSSIDTAGLADLATGLRAVPGVVEHGLFLDMAELALLGHEDGTVERLERG